MASQTLPFTCAHGLVLQVPAMHQVAEVSYGESPSCPHSESRRKPATRAREGGGLCFTGLDGHMFSEGSFLKVVGGLEGSPA